MNEPGRREEARAASPLLFLSTSTNRRTAAHVSPANTSGHPSESKIGKGQGFTPPP
jgi:hypothetical protein